MTGYTKRDMEYDGTLNERETKVVLTIFRAYLKTITGETKVPKKQQWVCVHPPFPFA